jgi:hypothetical protein
MFQSLNESFARLVSAHAGVAQPQVSPKPDEGAHASGMPELVEFVVFGSVKICDYRVIAGGRNVEIDRTAQHHNDGAS